MTRLRFLVLLVLCSFIARAQSLPMARNIQKAYLKGTRAASGAPGPRYWQNTADYTIHVDFDPATRKVAGSVDIGYVNNSPDTLGQVWFKLYPNLYKQGIPRESRIAAEDQGEGVVIDTLIMNGKAIDRSRINIDGTNMVLSRQSVLPGGTPSFHIVYHYTLNKGSHVRTGEVEPGADFVAYFFPRIAVYDDIDGWNKVPYTGSAEFYNDFCRFDAYVRVPRSFVVWATGTLQNCSDVLKPTYCQRIAQAEANDGITTVIDSTDADVTADRPFNTWHYTATDVTDFVFATSDHYIWKSTSLVVDPATGRRTRVDAAFSKRHKDYFEVVNDARKTVWAMSYVFPKWPYPYAHETVFDGLDQMEYPMMVNDNPLDNRAESIELTDHEIFHTMFPFYMGINETKYGWMDEGWATIGEWLISPIIDSTIVDEYGVAAYSKDAGNEIDVPITTPTPLLAGAAMFLNSYPKPAFGYLYIKDLLGDTLFNRALHHYIAQWHGHHPAPHDFFNSMNAGSGRNLNWFWKKWYFDNGYPDLSIASVNQKLRAYAITIESKGGKPVPIDLTITYADKSVDKIHYSIGVWEKGNTTYTITVPTTKKIAALKLGSTYTPDVHPQDNVYTTGRD